MPRKNRDHKRSPPYRNYTCFLVIICEGAVQEKEYFGFFKQISQRTGITVLPPENNESAPKHSLKRAQKYEREEQLNIEDNLWIVSDVDRWEDRDLGKVAKECKRRSNWHLAISNPCFEVWLLMHFMDVSEDDTSGGACKPFKKALKSHPDGYQAQHSPPASRMPYNAPKPTRPIQTTSCLTCQEPNYTS